MLSFEAFEKIVKSTVSGKIIEVALDEVALPQGGTATRELVFHPGGVGIVTITPEEKMLFVRQFRKPLERVILKFQRGKLIREGSHRSYRCPGIRRRNRLSPQKDDEASFHVPFPRICQ